MIMRNLPTFGNKRRKSIKDEEGSEYEKITDADLIRSDFEEYRGLGKASIDSHTMK
jgi:hypothetical protein